MLTARLVGVISEKGALRATLYQPAVDSEGKLLVAAAVGVSGDVASKTADLIETGVDVIVVDTAHGHQQRMMDALKAVRSVADSHPVVAGNVVTAAGVNDLLDAGADIVKVGVGPRRHVHDPDDDGSWPSSVFGGDRMCCGGPGAGKTHLGRRGSPTSARCALALAAGAASFMIGGCGVLRIRR